MKKTTMMLLSIIAMLMTACSSNDETQQQTGQSGSGWSEVVTVTAGTPGNNGGGVSSAANAPRRVKIDTDNPQKSLWETGDQLTIWTMTGSTCSTSNMSANGFTLTGGANTGTGKFSGRLKSTSAPTSSTNLIAIIDNGSDAIDASTGNSVTVDLSEQLHCTADSALDYELYYATSTNATRNFTFTHKMALVKWTIKVNGAANGDHCDIVLSGSGLQNFATLNPATGSLTPSQKSGTDGKITLKDVTLTLDASGNAELFLVVPPCTCSSGVTAKLTMKSGSNSGKLAIGKLGDGSAFSLAENRYYTASNEFTLLPVADLGLPSGTIWATCNVGATSPEGYGDYFAWGETEPYYSSQSPQTWKTGKTAGYYWESYKKFGTRDYHAYPDYGFTKYNKTNGPTTLDAVDDAATANWGSAWRMPKQEEWQELADNCYWEWTTSYNGVAGYIVYEAKNAAHKGKMKGSSGTVYDISSGSEVGLISGYTTNDTHIFLPAAGYRNRTDLYGQGSIGDYWSSSLSSYDSQCAWKLLFYDGYDGLVFADYEDYRSTGLAVRAVCAQ